MSQSAYELLKERFQILSNLGGASGILMKDMQTVMPDGSAEDRVHQLTSLSKSSQLMLKDPDVEKWLIEAEADAGSLSPADKRNLVLMRESWNELNALPRDLQNDLAGIGGKGEQVHEKYYKTGQWDDVKGWLKHVFDTTRKQGEELQKLYNTATPYEALMQQYNPDLKVADVEGYFKELEDGLRKIIPEALEQQKKRAEIVPTQGMLNEDQMYDLCLRLLKVIDFNFDKGRLDFIKGHPSMSGSPDDARLTARLDDDGSWVPPLFASLHEAGHGKYEQNLPKEHRYQPVGSAYGLVVHESQSMIMEYQACMTKEFFEVISKTAHDILGVENHPALTPENLFYTVCTVEPSLIRVDADELTYPMHVIVRFELEKALIDGTLDIEDLPAAWNAKMQEKLGVTPKNDNEGCMQDVHWFCGIQGYFPAYALGMMLSAQFFVAACKDKPEIPAEIANENFAPLTEWQRKNVHEQGSLLKFDELVTQATGETLNPKYYLDNMSRRYTGKPYTP